jgi:hypothetical protein
MFVILVIHYKYIEIIIVNEIKQTMLFIRLIDQFPVKEYCEFTNLYDGFSHQHLDLFLNVFIQIIIELSEGIISECLKSFNVEYCMQGQLCNLILKQFSPPIQSECLQICTLYLGVSLN